MLLVQNKTGRKKKTTHTEIPECHLQTPRVYKTAPWFHRKRSVLPFTWRFVLPQLLCLLTHLPAQHPKEAVGTCRWLRRASADLVARCAAAGSGDVQLLLRKQRQEWAEQSHGTAGRSGLCAVCFRISLSLIIFLSLGKKNTTIACCWS